MIICVPGRLTEFTCGDIYPFASGDIDTLLVRLDSSIVSSAAFLKADVVDHDSS